MKVVLLSALSLSLLVSALSNLTHQWENSFQHNRAAGRNLDEDYLWDLIKNEFRNNPSIELNKLACENFSITQNIQTFNLKYIFSRFDPQHNELVLCSSNILQNYSYRGPSGPPKLIDHNKPLPKTRDMTIYNIKYTLIQETIIQWLLKMRKTLKYITAIEFYENVTHYDSSFYIVKAYTTSNKNLFRVILEASINQWHIVKSYNL